MYDLKAGDKIVLSNFFLRDDLLTVERLDYSGFGNEQLVHVVEEDLPWPNTPKHIRLANKAERDANKRL